MKKTLLSLLALATAAVVSAQTEVSSITFSADENGTVTPNVVNATFTPVKEAYEVKADFPILKIGSSDDVVTVAPTGGLKAGDIITVKGFLSNGQETKNATLKIAYDGGSYKNETGFDAETSKGFPDIKDGVSGFNPGTEPGDIVFVVENEATNFTLKRNSISPNTDIKYGATTVFLVSIVITREASSETPGEGGDEEPNSISKVEAEVISVEYFTLTGVKVDEPTKGINIVKTTYSDNSVKTQTIVK